MTSPVLDPPAPPVEVATRARRDEAAEFVATFRELWPFAPRFLEQEGGHFQHFVDEGPRDARPVLAVHGNPTWSFTFRNLVEGLSTHYRVVAPDHMGCGISDKPQEYEYTLARHTENLERLVLALDLRDVTLLLHDWGGAIGMGLARRQPDRIARLVLMNTAAFPSKRMPLRIAACRWPLVGPLAVRGFGAFSRAALRMAVEHPERLTDAVRRGYLAPYADWHDRVATLAFVRDIPMDAGHPSWDELRATEAALAEFRDRPAALVWGEKDWCFSPAFREEWEERLPDARVHRLEGAGHWVHEDAPTEVLRSVGRFLTDTEPDAS